MSVLELLDDFPSVDLPFNVYLELLPPMRPRYYSISSCPAATSTCHLTVGVLRGPARSGRRVLQRGGLQPSGGQHGGQHAFTFVRKPTIPFRPPANPHTPMIMVGAGTGMAPFRGFLQERAAWPSRAPRREVGPVLSAAVTLSTTCSMPMSSRVSESGMTELQVAFSRGHGQPERTSSI